MQELDTSEELPKFRFHPNAYDLNVFERVAGTCDACGRGRTVRYTGSFYAVCEAEYICPWCVADGTAARVLDGQFSDYAGVEGVSPAPGRPATVDLEEAFEVSTRTPSYPSWQQEQWKSHCGRPCAFVGDIGAPDLADFLQEPDFAADVDGGLGWDPSVLRTHLRAGGDLAGYLFLCLTCGAHRLHVDAS